MVSARCKMAVKAALKKLNLHFVVVDLGEIEIMENISTSQREELKSALLLEGLELMDDKKAVLIERIKIIIAAFVNQSDQFVKASFSEYLSAQIGHDYSFLANLFSEVQGTTLEQYIIAHRVERIKELIIYDNLSITEIASKMNYSSVSHLSNQFKKATGLTPSHFKDLKSLRQKNPGESLDSKTGKKPGVQKKTRTLVRVAPGNK